MKGSRRRASGASNPPKASRGLQGPPPGASGTLRGLPAPFRGLQKPLGPGPSEVAGVSKAGNNSPEVSKVLWALQKPSKVSRNLQPVRRWSPAGLLELGARTRFLKGGPGVRGAENMEASFSGIGPLGLGYSHQKINVHCICLAYWGGWRQGLLYTSTLHRLLPLSDPVRVYRLTCIFSV